MCVSALFGIAIVVYNYIRYTTNLIYSYKCCFWGVGPNRWHRSAASHVSIRLHFSVSSMISAISSTMEFSYYYINWLIGFSGRIPRLLLIQYSLYVWVIKKPTPRQSQGSSMERWSRNTLRVATARVFYVLRGSLYSPFIFNNSVETAALFNVVSHPQCCEPRN